MRKFLCAAVAVLSAVSPANAGCWSADHASAARVRDLQTFLMVETLRCQAMGFNISADYNAFVRANRGAIGAANDRIKAFFIGSAGPVYGQTAYDRFTTSLANAYGAARTNADSCATARSTAAEAALMANSHEGLTMIADRQGLNPALPGGRCGQETMAVIGQ
ncbi:hypothetical protein [Sphingomonas sp. SRS2]|uniref:hypothetical protein n=1 Tax=Sphingomonas sp. SRS2 TaxID=133190 RepID=UPI000698F320|nr:hypothetical protein [Sphingomonas sp. SRS2]